MQKKMFMWLVHYKILILKLKFKQNCWKNLRNTTQMYDIITDGKLGTEWPILNKLCPKNKSSR
jgi:hypothetical protein